MLHDNNATRRLLRAKAGTSGRCALLRGGVMTRPTLDVLFLWTGNAARSFIAGSVLSHLGQGQAS